MIVWTCNSFFIASDWAIQNNELMTALTCRQTGHTACFGIFLAMIADGSTCCLMSDGDATLVID